MRHAVIIAAAGSSTRFNLQNSGTSKKEFLNIEGKSVLARSVEPFLEIPDLVCVVVICRKGDIEEVGKLLLQLDFKAVKLMLVEGGSTRQESVFNGLKALYEQKKELDIELVAIHDGARPFVSTKLIKACLEAAKTVGGACPCIRITDTLVKVNEDGLLTGRLSREGVCAVQTPQVFRFPDIYKAHLEAVSAKAYTDDTEIFMDYGGSVAFVQGDAANRKITYASDLEVK